MSERVRVRVMVWVWMIVWVRVRVWTIVWVRVKALMEDRSDDEGVGEGSQSKEMKYHLI